MSPLEFTSKFSGYEDPYNAGVLLPEISITKEEYESVGLDKGATNAEFLRAICRKKFKEMGIGKLKNSKEYSDRILMELEIFEELGFVDYILLNWDIIGKSKRKGIPIGAGRGSAAGCLVLYLIDVTGIDSLKHELFFERFVSRERARKIEHKGKTYLDGGLLPDVDNDISYDRRQEVIHYIEEQYAGRTAKILTINTLAGKLCVRECVKLISGVDEEEAGKITDSIPKIHGQVSPIQEAVQESEVFAGYMKEYPEAYKIAKKLEGLNKNAGVHPSGIAISNGEIRNLMPLQLTNDGDIVTGYDMRATAELVVKFDVLGLRTLTVVDETLKSLGMTEDDIDIEDTSIYEYCQGNVPAQGLFQIEADTNYRVFKDVKPRNIAEISDVLALARPGALAFVEDYVNNKGRKDFMEGSDYEYFEDVLSYTSGIPLFQEQLMKMANKIGFSLDESEQIRRAAAKKKPEEMAKWKKKIEEKTKENNINSSIGDALWTVAESSANYSFNKSHAISYAYLTAKTLYLKKHHPKEFYTSLLKMAKSEPETHPEIAKISQELNNVGIPLYPPHLIKSKIEFSPEGKGIRYGLDTIKGISEKSIPKLMEFRNSESNNKIEFFDVAKQSGIPISIMSALIYAGSVGEHASKSRGRSYMALEAQLYNLFTDREKREVANLGEAHNYDILNIIKKCLDDQTLGTNGKPIFPESRFLTINKKYKKYKQVYLRNRKHEDFTNWFFENTLLGYSHSKTLKEVFNKSFAENITQINEIKGGRVDIVGTVQETIGPKIAASGNRYFKMNIGDETGSINVMLMNNKAGKKLDRFLVNNDLPEKGNIVHVKGSMPEGGNADIIFVNSLSVIDKKVYLKFSEIKD